MCCNSGLLMGGSQYGLVKTHIQTMSTKSSQRGISIWKFIKSIFKPCPPRCQDMLLQLRMGGSQYGLVKIHIQTMTTRNHCAATLDSGRGDLNMSLLKPIFKPCPPRAPNRGSQYGLVKIHIKTMPAKICCYNTWQGDLNMDLLNSIFEPCLS